MNQNNSEQFEKFDEIINHFGFYKNMEELNLEFK